MTTAQIACFVAAAILSPAIMGIIFGKATNPMAGPQLMMQYGPEKGLDKWRNENYKNDGRLAFLVLVFIPATVYIVYAQF